MFVAITSHFTCRFAKGFQTSAVASPAIIRTAATAAPIRNETRDETRLLTDDVMAMSIARPLCKCAAMRSNGRRRLARAGRYILRGSPDRGRYVHRKRRSHIGRYC